MIFGYDPTQTMPVIPSAEPDSSGTSLSERMTSPMFLMGMGLLLGGLQGDGLKGLTAGSTAAAAFQRNRAAEEAAKARQAKERREEASRAQLAQALTPTGAPPQTGAGAVQPQAAMPGGRLGQIRQTMERIRPLALMGDERAAGAYRLLMQEAKALEPSGAPDSAGEVIAAQMAVKYGPNWQSNATALAEAQGAFQSMKRAGAAQVKVAPSFNPFFARPQLVKGERGQLDVVGQTPEGGFVVQNIREPQSSSPEAKAAQEEIDVIDPIIANIDTVQAISKGGPVRPGTMAAGSVETAYTAAVTQLAQFYQLGALSGPDMQILENQLGDNPASWTANAKQAITLGGWGTQQKAQLAEMKRILERARTRAEGRLDKHSPSRKQKTSDGRPPLPPGAVRLN